MVADAARSLMQAGQQLGQGQPGDSTQPGQPGQENQAGQAQPGQSKPGQSEPGQAEPGQSTPQPGQGEQLANAQNAGDQAGAETPADGGDPSGQSPAEPSNNPAGGQQAQTPASDGLTQSLQQAAEALANASAQLQCRSGQPNRGGTSETSSDGTPRERDDVPVDISQLRSQLERLSSRDWGKLPGHLQTEILDAARNGNNSDYERLIKSYFQDIADVNPEKK
jgi:hypothetical protein